MLTEKPETLIGKVLWRGGIATAIAGAVITWGAPRMARSAMETATACYQGDDHQWKCDTHLPNPGLADVETKVGQLAPAVAMLGLAAIAAAGTAERRRLVAVQVQAETVSLALLEQPDFDITAEPMLEAAKEHTY
jgi:hypothetical protein